MKMPFKNTDYRECERVQTLLSEYTDGTLSARQMWEVERHLADCKECTAQAQQMRTLVEALRSAERHTTPDAFMLKLHARLDTLGPVPQTKPSWQERWRDTWPALREVFSLRRASLVGAGLAAVGLVVFFMVGRPAFRPMSFSPSNAATQTSLTQHLQQALERHVATAAADPLDDPTAERLAAPPSLDNESGDSE